MTRNQISNAHSAVADKYVEFETNSCVLVDFRDFVRKVKVWSTVSYLIYKVGISFGAIEHQDVNDTFFSSLIMINDSSLGRLHILWAGLPGIFDAGDLVFTQCINLFM